MNKKEQPYTVEPLNKLSFFSMPRTLTCFDLLTPFRSPRSINHFTQSGLLLHCSTFIAQLTTNRNRTQANTRLPFSLRLLRFFPLLFAFHGQQTEKLDGSDMWFTVSHVDSAPSKPLRLDYSQCIPDYSVGILLP